MGFIHQSIKSYSLFCILLLMFCSFAAPTTAIDDTLRVNQSLRYPDTLLSSGAKFKLGFFSPPNSTHFYLGVMYNLPVMTVVWVANRNKPLLDSVGRLELSSDGNLVILDRRNDIIWSTNLSNPVPDSTAQLLDTGNLVLLDNSNNSNRYVWESFQHASDSCIEKMKIITDTSMNEKNMLTSWRSVSDPSPGNFTLTIEPRVVPQIFIWNNGYPYWRSGPWNRQVFTGISKMSSVSKEGTDVVSNSFSSAYVTFTLLNLPLVYVALNASGDLLQKAWSGEKGEWEITWSSKGSECGVYGNCGPFGKCDAEKMPICGCFRGFVPKRNHEWEAGNWTSGCTRRTGLECKEDGFVKMESVKLPDGGTWFPSKETECRVQCLDNCSCIAYSYTFGIGCMQWAESLIDVQRLSNVVTHLYIRLAHSELGNKRKRKAIIIVAVILGSVAIPLCAYFVWKYRGRKEKDEVIWSTTELEKILQDGEHGVTLEELPIFNFEMLSSATQKFSLNHKLGEGGFGAVYKGILPNGVEIAVKRLARSSNQGVEEFVNEVKVISRLQHRNLVRLLGCCVESEEKMLVYEYMPNRSLDSYLFDSHKRKRVCLDWRARVIIINGICRGLLYLHRDSRLRIIHRDLKASNILLDEEMNPKISDFGMARIFGGNDDQAKTTRVVGTYGYMAPEYALRGIFSEKSDVFSFGVLLLEILSGMRNGHSFLEDQTLFLVGYAWKLWNEGNIVNLIDPTIYDPRMERDVQRYANVGLLCVQEIAAERPNISTLVSMLISSEIAELPRPKQPAFLGIQRFSKGEPSKNNSTKYSLNDVSITSVEGR